MSPALTLLGAFLIALSLTSVAIAITSRDVGDDLGRQLDALSGGWVADVPAADRYARFEHRDYSGDRGVTPAGPPPATIRWGSFVVPVWTDLYAELVERLGDPMGGAT